MSNVIVEKKLVDIKFEVVELFNCLSKYIVVVKDGIIMVGENLFESYLFEFLIFEVVVEVCNYILNFIVVG